MDNKDNSAPELFWANVDKNGPVLRSDLGPCWLWVGHRWKSGYGQTAYGTDRSAHRASYRLSRGPIPAKGVVRHLCNNPPCVNPEHLALGTQVDNYQDSVNAGTAPFGERNGRSKHSAVVIQKVKRLFAANVTQAEIGRRLMLHKATVNDIVLGRRRVHG